MSYNEIQNVSLFVINEWMWRSVELRKIKTLGLDDLIGPQPRC